jgi:hypothetical protein
VVFSDILPQIATIRYTTFSTVLAHLLEQVSKSNLNYADYSIGLATSQENSLFDDLPMPKE